MLGLEAFQWLLDTLGALMAWIYDLIPNWGLTIIVLTILIRMVLLPLGVKQIRSMQSMQAIQPKMKEIQRKYKQNKQRQQEEMMRLYREHGVSPFAGCWPVLLQFPILIAMYSVIRFPQYPVHVPTDSALYQAIQPQIPEPDPAPAGGRWAEQPPRSELVTRDGEQRWIVREVPPTGTTFLSMNLLCSARNAWAGTAEIPSRYPYEGKPVYFEVDCANSIPQQIPYYLFAAAMFATTYFQQRQMQKASPPGAASQQQQQLMRIMPLMFGVFGIFFPAGLVVYWTTSNLWQIGQQYFMLQNRPTAETLAARADGKKKRGGMFSNLMDRANKEAKRRDSTSDGSSSKPSSGDGGSSGSRGSGGSRGGSRKKRPKR
jgi:YidC/Oxa1 family membrane protein insertase